jgi:hypothetical protein
VIFNRADGSCAPRTRNIQVLVADGPGGPFRLVYSHNGETFYGVKENKPLEVSLKDKEVTARVVRLQIPGRCSFALDEVEVYAADDPTKNVALGKPADQKSVGRYSFPGTMDESAAIVFTGGQPTAAAAATFSLAHVRDVLARGAQLGARLRPGADPNRLGPLLAELDRIGAPRYHIDLFIANFRYNSVDPCPLLANTGADRIHIGVVRIHGDLRA